MSDAWPPIGTTRPHVAADANARERIERAMIRTERLNRGIWVPLLLLYRRGRSRSWRRLSCGRRLCCFGQRQRLGAGRTRYNTAFLWIHFTFRFKLLQELL